MPANKNRQPAGAVAPAASPMPMPTPTPKATAKYTNKDGTKYISVPKSSTSTPPPQPSPTTTSSSRGGAPTNGTLPSDLQPPPLPPTATVNKKKQKRRAKAAAKAAAEKDHAAAAGASTAATNGLPSPASTSSAPLPTHRKHPPTPHHVPLAEQVHTGANDYNDDDWGEETESDDDHHNAFPRDSQHLPTNGSMSKSKKSKKKKKPKKEVAIEPESSRPSGISREKIWNTSGPEERERIKQFWLGLGEDERKSLVKVEKDAVLRKMKEQQKHTCSCSVCGRKRTAIEEELEGLYDAYYQELESFANQPHTHPSGPPMFAPKRFGPMSGLHPPGVMPSTYPDHHPPRGRMVEHVDNEEDELEVGDDEYSDEEDLEDEEDEDEPEEIPRDSYPNDFFHFGQSLTVKGGILTVADDLLKNDGKKFIEMMEQLAERRMAREEDATHYPNDYNHGVNGGLSNPHNHPPPEEDEYGDEEEEEDEYESQEDDYEEEEEEDQMTEEQRMEEGRRMFQIFAARMFEQRVLAAYREKVAKERQEKLLEELEQEETQESQRKAKKAKDAQRRKEKALQKKQALLEEKARRESEKAAEEQARLAEEARRTEESRARAEERRKKKEAQKKADEEERLRKEAEKQRRAHEQKEKQAEQERKAREAKEREKKLKEEQRRKEQEAREIKERETRERREKHEKDKREKELRAAHAKAEREAKEKSKQEEKAAVKPHSLAPPIPVQPVKKQHPISIPALPQQPVGNHASPQIPVATPILPPLAHTPIKPRSVSQEVTRSGSQASHSLSGPSQTASPHAISPPHASPGPIGPPSKTQSTGPLLQTMSPHHGTIKNPPGLPQSPFDMSMPPMPIQMPPGIPPMVHGFPRMQDPIFPPILGQFRTPGIPVPPPGLGGPMGGRPYHMPPPGFPPPGVDIHLPSLHQGFSPESAAIHQSPHSRQGSTSFDTNHPSTQPIGKPIAPIGRPDSIVHGQRNHNMSADIDDMSNHLGSSALLDDTDEPILDRFPVRHATAAPGAPTSRPSFAGPSFMSPAFGSSGTVWDPPGVFQGPPGFGHVPGSAAWPPNPAFGVPSHVTRLAQPRSVVIRQLLVRACKELENYAADPKTGFIDLSVIKGHVDSINPSPSESIEEDQILEICETVGNPHNGGGSFDIRHEDSGKFAIRFSSNLGALGEITSPIVGAGMPISRG
ncbi:hypothetical protein F5Y14DRAFT_211696 [Nemania sp. NC0429]|nr:hypothetical protein F5Y14DRAFT_211696 [Nemania sp. NC0429]